MGRIKKYINVGSNKFWALFDSGARNTYVVEEVAKLMPIYKLNKSEPVALGGQSHLITQECRLSCEIDGYEIRSMARVLYKIGNDENGKTIDILIGALTMQEWSIILIPEKEDIDMSNYPHVFVEF